MRTVNKLKCKICNDEFSSAGFGNHLKSAHNISPDDYVTRYGEYRINKLKALKIHNSSNTVYKCVVDTDDKTYTERALTYHLKVNHKISKRDYILKYLLNGKQPLCKCGCGQKTRINSYDHPHALHFKTGHNSSGELNPMFGKTHSDKSKAEMTKQAKLRINDAKRKNKILHWHSIESIEKRGKSYSNTMMNRRLNKHDVKLLSTNDELNKKFFKYKCKKCNSEFEERGYASFVCDICHPKVKSKYENELGKFLSNNGIPFIQNHRKLLNNKFEIDFYIPELNIGIEFNGLYYHSEISGGKHKNYHTDKLKTCNDNGVDLIQIFEDEWVNKKDIVLSKLKNKLNILHNNKIYARNVKIKEIGNTEKNIFLMENHIQGSDVSKYKYGGYINDELVSVMTFSTPNISKGNKNVNLHEYELSRYCCKHDIICVGMFSKFLKHFIKNQTVSKIITFADRRYSGSNNVYEKCGFKLTNITPPNYWYYHKNEIKRHHRFSFNKHTIIEKYNGNPNISEWENMKNMNFDRIWDCGNFKYEFFI
jgi:hypothetical protein